MESENIPEIPPPHPQPTTNPQPQPQQQEEHHQSSKKPTAAAAATINDRLKRDEWSEGAVSSLLEAYESKWVLRNRAKLKGHDWEDVARHVSSRANNTKSPKTQTQCKNKIESMKKRYRSESANGGDGSSWLLYPRLDLLLRGTHSSASSVQPHQYSTVVVGHGHGHQHHQTNPGGLLLMEPSPVVVVQPPPPQPQPPPPPPPPPAQNSHGSNGLKEGEAAGGGTKTSEQGSDKKGMETDSSTPAMYSQEKEKLIRNNKKQMMKSNKRRKREDYEIAESIRWLAEVMVRSEQARMDTMREIEKMRVEAEAKRGELDLKRTEIIANTQLEIAKLFASGKPVDSSLRIGRN